MSVSSDESSPTGTGRGRWLSVSGSAMVVAVSTWLLIRLLDPIGFTIDEWMFVADRHDWSIRSLLRAHNGHTAIIPAVAYLVGFHTVGLGSMWYYKALLISIHLGVCALLAQRVWRRHGPFVALAAWVTVCFMGAGAQNVVQLFQIGMNGSVLFFLVSLVMLERVLDSRRKLDALWLALALTASIACSTVGLAAVVAVGAVLVADRRTWPHLWSVVAPAMLYLVWKQAYGEDVPTSSDWGIMLRFVWAAVRTSGAALGYGNEVLGATLVCGLFLLTGWRIARRHSPLLLAGATFVLSFWVLTAYGRAEMQAAFGDISPSRYRYVAIVGLLVMINDAVRPMGRDLARRLAVAGVAATASVTSVWLGHSELMSWKETFANWTSISRARLTVVDAYPDVVPRDEWVDPLLASLDPSRVIIADYLEASRHLHSTAGLTRSEFADMPTRYLFGAEELILPLLQVSERPSPECVVVDAQGGRIVLEPGDEAFVTVGSGGAVVASRWLDPAPAGPGTRALSTGNWQIVAPRDDLPGSWTIVFDGDVRMLDCP